MTLIYIAQGFAVVSIVAALVALHYSGRALKMASQALDDAMAELERCDVILALAPPEGSE